MVMEKRELAEMKIGFELPSNKIIYGASILSVLASLFMLKKNPLLATFAGLWAPTILGLGIFLKENKLIDLEKGHTKSVKFF